MIPVDARPEPPTFCAAVRLKGLRTLACQLGLDDPHPLTGRLPAAALPEARVAEVRALPSEALLAALPALLREIPTLSPHWQACIPDLHTAYGGICAYLGIYIMRGTGLPTVDHLIPKDVAPALAYEWGNFRLAAHLVNTLKGTGAHLDPLRIEDGWFRLDLVTGEVLPNPDLRDADPDVFAAVDHTIEALHLNDARFVSDRQTYIEWARDPGTCAITRAKAPFVYREAARQGWAGCPPASGTAR